MNFNDSVIITIPSIGYIYDGMILGKIGDTPCFSIPSKMPAISNLEPSVYQSGNFRATFKAYYEKNGR